MAIIIRVMAVSDHAKRAIPGLLGLLVAAPLLAGELRVSIDVLDPETFESRPPEGEVAWQFRGPGGERREVRAAEADAVFDLRAGRYGVVVWETESRAATRFDVSVPETGSAAVSALLSTLSEDVIPPPPSDPEPGVAAALPGPDALGPATPTPAPPEPADEAAQAPEPSVAEPRPPTFAESAGRPDEPVIRLVPSFAAGAPIRMDFAPRDGAEADLVGFADGSRSGWINAVTRDGRDSLVLTAPDVPGTYRLEYVAMPAMTVIDAIEIVVE